MPPACARHRSRGRTQQAHRFLRIHKLELSAPGNRVYVWLTNQNYAPRKDCRMAKHTQVILIDDLDGGEANETVAFAIDGTSYEIDLSDGNAKRLRDALSPFVGG